MYGPEGNSFVFPRVLMFPETKSQVPLPQSRTHQINTKTQNIHHKVSIPSICHSSIKLKHYYYYSTLGVRD